MFKNDSPKFVVNKPFARSVPLARRLLLAPVILAWIAAAFAGPRDIPLAESFPAEAAAARAKRVPILVLFSLPGCPYCDRARREFLLPMQRNPEYAARVIIRQVDVNGTAKLRDFSGKLTTHGRFAQEHNVRLAPTVKLFDAEGRELTEPIVGLLTPDYYGGYLDRAIDEALEKIRGEKPEQALNRP